VLTVIILAIMRASASRIILTLRLPENALLRASFTWKRRRSKMERRSRFSNPLEATLQSLAWHGNNSFHLVSDEMLNIVTVWPLPRSSSTSEG
jgi:hypothetical protein